MAEEEEVTAELEAVLAVYGDDCEVIETYPPHLHVRLKPRTADVFSQQFVEAVIGIHAGQQYPEEPPHISIIDSKGLDEERQKHLITSISDKASEFASCLMLIALCEEAVERLSSMNHPDGDCPLCLYPLVDEDAGTDSLPFMKLMSCFHCFHCHCIIKWWNWLQMQKETGANASTALSPHMNTQHQRDVPKMMEEGLGKCPVCRKVFLAKDIEHVLDLVGTHSLSNERETEVDEDFMKSESEIIRRQKFEAILKIQQQNSGLIEPKKVEVLLPGMYLPQPVAVPSTEPDSQSAEPQTKDIAVRSETSSGSSFQRPSSSRHPNPRARRRRSQNSRKQVREWIRKDNDTN